MDRDLPDRDPHRDPTWTQTSEQRPTWTEIPNRDPRQRPPLTETPARRPFSDIDPPCGQTNAS